MAKLKIYHIGEEAVDQWHRVQYHYMCPGCGWIHAVHVKEPGNTEKGHTWNGSMDKPTFSPSMLCDWDPAHRCHSYIENGMIRYLSDCWHTLAGKTVEMPEIE
jgi:hypothetical protein